VESGARIGSRTGSRRFHVPALASPEAVVTPLVAKDLPDFKGKEGVMILVEYPPGASDPIHRHNAHAFVYVLEGSIVMQVRDAAEVTLSPGQTYSEPRQLLCSADFGWVAHGDRADNT